MGTLCDNILAILFADLFQGSVDLFLLFFFRICLKANIKYAKLLRLSLLC